MIQAYNEFLHPVSYHEIHKKLSKKFKMNFYIKDSLQDIWKYVISNKRLKYDNIISFILSSKYKLCMLMLITLKSYQDYS